MGGISALIREGYVTVNTRVQSIVIDAATNKGFKVIHTEGGGKARATLIHLADGKKMYVGHQRSSHGSARAREQTGLSSTSKSEMNVVEDSGLLTVEALAQRRVEDDTILYRHSEWAKQ